MGAEGRKIGATAHHRAGLSLHQQPALPNNAWGNQLGRTGTQALFPTREGAAYALTAYRALLTGHITIGEEDGKAKLL